MFSGGYDQSAMIWRRWEDGSPPTLMKALKHRAEVDILAVNRNGVLATAAKRWKKAIKVCRIRTEDDIVHSTYSSKKADQRPDQKILPTALQFEPKDGRLLLAGFGANKRQDRLDTTGDICLWDIQEEKELNVHGSALNIFDISWMPNQIERKLFAVGCVAGQNVNRGTRSVVRLYDGRGHDKRTMVVEIECPALDMNDLVICPHDEYLVAAGCTSGRTYVWDFRRPDSFLYSLSHGKSAMPLDEFEDRELADTGVRFLSWGDNITRLYTGSSDGIVKVWDVARSEQDVFIKDLVKTDSGIMSGSFSPDKSRLIVGEVNGSINVLEVGKDDYTLKDATQLQYLPYEDDFEDTDSVTTAASAHTDSGQAIASELLNTGQMVNVPFGGFPIRQTVQGPNYAGPFDRTIDAPFLREQALEFQLNQPRTSEPHCSIPACSDAIVKTTFEEIGDSGRSSDRIPDELREQWKMIGSSLTVNPGKSMCSSCGRPARISDSVTFEQDKPVALCERCHFSCFRCGAVCDLDPATSKLICSTCSRVWDVGVLGYECLEDTGRSIIRLDVPSLEGFGRDLKKQDFLEADASFGDEMNALTDHYLSLAIDRPESPPL
jgi:WD40 repeat protein